MIFITLGSQKFQFNRLLKEIDRLVQEKDIDEVVFAQIGYSDYEPNNFKYKRFLDRTEFSEITSKADIIITHGGTGAIIGAIKKGKKVIAIPRLAQYGEHVDDHQLQLIEQFKEQNLICGIQNCDELLDAMNYTKEHEFEKYISNTEQYIVKIKKCLDELR